MLGKSEGFLQVQFPSEVMMENLEDKEKRKKLKKKKNTLPMEAHPAQTAAIACFLLVFFSMQVFFFFYSRDNAISWVFNRLIKSRPAS